MQDGYSKTDYFGVPFSGWNGQCSKKCSIDEYGVHVSSAGGKSGNLRQKKLNLLEILGKDKRRNQKVFLKKRHN